MLNSLPGFELKYHFRQLSFMAAMILFAALGFLMSRGNFGGPDLHKNSPYVINYILCLLTLLSIFISTVCCANVVLRDTTWRMEAQVNSSGISKTQWFFSKLGGLVIVVCFVLLVAIAGCVTGWLAAASDRLGPWELSWYAWPLLVFGLPNIFFVSSLVFAAAVMTKSARAVYIAGVLLFVLYFTGSILGNSPLLAGSELKTGDTSILPLLLDPFGIIAFFDETRNWTLLQRNGQLFPFSTPFVQNRLLWLIISFTILFFSYRSFSFSIPEGSRKKRKQEKEKKNQDIPEFLPVAVSSSGAIYLRQVFRAQLRLETRALFRHLPFVFLLLLWIFLFVIDLKEEALEGPYGIKYRAETGFMIEKLICINPAIFLLVFYASEILHRERLVRMNGILFSTPAPGRIIWLAKAATLLLLVLILVSANIITGICMQWYFGASPEPGWYASLYYLSALPMILFAILILFVQALIPNKFLGMMLSLVVCGVFIFGRMLGIKALVFRFASLPDLRWSALNGFGHHTEAVHWYIFYWGILTLLITWLAIGCWQRNIAGLVRAAGNRSGMLKCLPFLLLLVWVSTGAYIRGRSGTGMPRNWKYEYETKFGADRDMAQPMIIAVTTKVELYPEQQRYHVEGRYRLRNETHETIHQLWMAVHPEVTSVSWDIPAAKQIRKDDTFKQYWFRLEKPLLPGEGTEIGFSMDVDRNSFLPFNSEHSVVSNGSYIELEKYIPFLGYDPSFEIDDPVKRAEKKLPPQMPYIGTDSSYHFIDYETYISTAPEQEVVTVGRLMEKWNAGGRAHFHFRSERKIPFMLALSSARYAIKEEKWNGKQFTIYYQPGQEQNLPVLMQGMKDAIGYGEKHFSSYPEEQLSLAVIPHYPGAATAYPGVIFSAEKINFISDQQNDSSISPVYIVTAHETAHQWWADILSPRPVPGNAMLTESLAKYTEIVVAEKRYGKEALREYLKKDHQLYFSIRNMNSEQELPLLQSDQSFVYYQKAGLAFYAVSRLLGEERMTMALQRLLRNYGQSGLRPEPADLYRVLCEEASEKEKDFIRDRLQKVIFYDAAIRLLSCHQVDNAKWELQLELSVKKWDHTNGKPVMVKPDEKIELSVYERDPLSGAHPVKTEWIPVSGAHQIAKIMLEQKPVAVILDPYFGLTDAVITDNELRIP